ncbi:hypothetical protein TIFTF001_040614 [Ficus carica]|uniref:Serine-threonine/tyrosine-protein kinase catalytic domain-containing protein n=1 Tax=Ficus carica TaxID=3494 RepID=A0AA87Z5I7_FICCA|nr:hypothetical protein TIFTF001_040610 [Ficus carica]GMN24750.1 hypothetical protein TIFTF001_040614 [Ficus carica]
MYSFGAVALESACGRRTYKDGEYHVPLTRWVCELYRKGTVLEAADERLDGNFRSERNASAVDGGIVVRSP